MISRKNRLGRLDTRWVLKKGESLTTDLFIVRYLKIQPVEGKEATPPKFTVVTSTKLAKKAVDRNRVKRRINEALRLKLNEVKNTSQSWKVAIIPKKRALDVEYTTITKDIKKLITSLNNG